MQSDHGEYSGDRPVPIGQQARGTSSIEQWASAQSSNYATPADSHLRQQKAISSTPKAFKHESLGRDISHLQLSFSTILSPGEHPDQTPAEPTESFTTALEGDPEKNGEDVLCEEVVFPVSISPRVTLTKSRSDGCLMQGSPHKPAQGGQQAQADTKLKPPKRPSYQRQNSASEKAR